MKHILLLIITAFIACSKPDIEEPTPIQQKWNVTVTIPSQGKIVSLQSYLIQDNLGSWNNACNCHPDLGTVVHLKGWYNSEEWYMLIIENDVQHTTTITGSINGISYIINTNTSMLIVCNESPVFAIITIKKQ